MSASTHSSIIGTYYEALRRENIDEGKAPSYHWEDNNGTENVMRTMTTDDRYEDEGMIC